MAPKRQRDDDDIIDPKQRERNWFFTLNNYTEEECATVVELCSQCTWAVVGKEIGKKCGTPHLQGCIWLKNAKTASAIRKLLPRLWLRKLISEKAAQYCAKDKDCLVNNPPPCEVKAGARTDIARAISLLDEGKGLAEIGREVHNYQALRHVELIKKYTRYDAREIHGKVVYWVYGPSMTGKSTWAFSHAPYYRKGPGKWWNGYDGQATVVIDEMRANWFDWPTLLIWLDKWSFNAETKGGYVDITATTIIVTCPEHPCDMFKDQSEDLFQLTRRITRIIPSDELPKPE